MGFDDMNATEWIWAMPQRADQTNYFYIAPHAFTDNINDGYGLAFWNKDFVSLFSSSDVRNTFFDLYRVWVTAMSIMLEPPQNLLSISVQTFPS